MKYNKHAHPILPLRLTLLAGLLLLSGALAAAAQSYSPPPAQAQPASAQAALEAVPAAAAAEEETASGQREIIVRDTGGVVCVYEGGRLIYKTEIPVASLPAQDRSALSSGIPVASEEEMHQLLEDLGS